MLKNLLNISMCVSACAFAFGFVACSDDNTAGVTEDGNPIAHGESSSSAVGGSSAVESSSSVVGGSSAIESSSAVQSSSSVVAVPKLSIPVMKIRDIGSALAMMRKGAGQPSLGLCRWAMNILKMHWILFLNIVKAYAEALSYKARNQSLGWLLVLRLPKKIRRWISLRGAVSV